MPTHSLESRVHALAHEVRCHRSSMMYDVISSARCPPYPRPSCPLLPPCHRIPPLSPSVPRHLIAVGINPAAPPRSHVPAASGALPKLSGESSNHEPCEQIRQLNIRSHEGCMPWSMTGMAMGDGVEWVKAYVPRVVTGPSFSRLLLRSAGRAAVCRTQHPYTCRAGAELGETNGPSVRSSH